MLEFDSVPPSLEEVAVPFTNPSVFDVLLVSCCCCLIGVFFGKPEAAGELISESSDFRRRLALWGAFCGETTEEVFTIPPAEEDPEEILELFALVNVTEDAPRTLIVPGIFAALELSVLSASAGLL